MCTIEYMLTTRRLSCPLIHLKEDLIILLLLSFINSIICFTQEWYLAEKLLKIVEKLS